MKIVTIRIEDLEPYKNNPRINTQAVGKVAESIKQFGFKVPVIVDKDNVIVAGHTRYKAAQMLNIDEIPCIVADDLSEEQINAFRLADNKVAEFSSWDFEKLDEELRKISNLDLGSLGFVENEDVDIDEFFCEAAEPKTEKEPKKIKCPHCGEMIEI